MAEEFIEDIIGTDEAPKTGEEAAAEIQDNDESKPAVEDPKVGDDKSESGAEGDPAVVQDGESKENETESDAVKELASQLGWREDHKGDDAVDAKTYILKSKDIQKSMSKHNKDLKDQLQVLNSSVSALKTHNESVYQAEVKKLQGEVAALKAERRAAIELADVTKVDELDKQIDEKQRDIDAPKPADLQDDGVADNPIYNEWVKDNQWYLDDAEMAAYAETVAQQYDGAPLDRLYGLVRNKVQEVFPDKFEAVKSTDAKKTVDDKTPVGPKSPVEGSSAKINAESFTKADLSADQVQIMNQFVRSGIMTEEQYINDIAKMQ